MTFTFLGTSAGTPTRSRNVSAIGLMLEKGSKWYLFDCGEGTQHQILRSDLSIGGLDKIFITHLHGDHSYGLMGLIASKSMNEVKTTLEIYAPKGIKKFIDSIMEVTNLHLCFELKVIEVNAGDKFKFKDFDVEVLELNHSVESFAYHIIEHDKMGKFDKEKAIAYGIKPSKVYAKLKNGEVVTLKDGRIIDGKLFSKEPTKGRRVIIAGDNYSPEILNPELKNIDLLIHEATYTEETYNRLSLKLKHSTAKKVAIASHKARVKNLILTHISPRYRFKPQKTKECISILAKEARDNFDGEFFIASDFDKYYLDRYKKLSVKGCRFESI